jgi:hypothetical protein
MPKKAQIGSSDPHNLNFDVVDRLDHSPLEPGVRRIHAFDILDYALSAAEINKIRFVFHRPTALITLRSYNNGLAVKLEGESYMVVEIRYFAGSQKVLQLTPTSVLGFAVKAATVRNNRLSIELIPAAPHISHPLSC